MAKEEVCKYCGMKNLNGHHCSGKKAYQKGFNDGELSMKSKEILMQKSQEHVTELVQEVDKIVEKI